MAPQALSTKGPWNLRLFGSFLMRRERQSGLLEECLTLLVQIPHDCALTSHTLASQRAAILKYMHDIFFACTVEALSQLMHSHSRWADPQDCLSGRGCSTIDRMLQCHPEVPFAEVPAASLSSLGRIVSTSIM